MLSWTSLPSWGILLNMNMNMKTDVTFLYVVDCAISLEGAQWLSGRVLDVVPLSKNINPSLVLTGSTQGDPSLYN